MLILVILACGVADAGVPDGASGVAPAAAPGSAPAAPSGSTPAAPAAAPGSAPAAAPSGAAPPAVPSAPPPPVPFTCADAATALGQPGATVVLCSEPMVLKGLFRVRLEGGPVERLDRVVVVEGGVLSTEQGGDAMVRFLRRSPLWSAKRVSSAELRDALDAFAAWPPGFSRESLRTVDDIGQVAWVTLPELALTLQARAAPPGDGGVSHAPVPLRATLRGGPSRPFAWTIEERRDDAWRTVRTIVLE